ncbi:chemotaxis-specific methylesterase, partial [Pseudomonas syringae pv. pisi str. 1704B]
NGADAVQRCVEQTPDLILMDLIMPVMDGVEATRRIMAETPCAIVIVTVDREQNMRRVFEAMGHGALDVV